MFAQAPRPRGEAPGSTCLNAAGASWVAGSPGCSSPGTARPPPRCSRCGRWRSALMLEERRVRHRPAAALPVHTHRMLLSRMLASSKSKWKIPGALGSWARSCSCSKYGCCEREAHTAQVTPHVNRCGASLLAQTPQPSAAHRQGLLHRDAPARVELQHLVQQVERLGVGAREHLCPVDGGGPREPEDVVPCPRRGDEAQVRLWGRAQLQKRQNNPGVEAGCKCPPDTPCLPVTAALPSG